MKHDGYISESFTGSDYRAGCSCGWESEEVSTREEADAELAQHYKESKS